MIDYSLVYDSGLYYRDWSIALCFKNLQDPTQGNGFLKKKAL